jgi:chemotaxis protein methyltransferase CheR
MQQGPLFLPERPLVTERASALDATLRSISDREFRLFQELIYREAGIHLSDVKRALLVGRLAKRLRQLGLDRFGAYYERVVGDSSGAELVFLLDAITTNETSFFREPRQFDYLQQVICPAWERAAQEGRRARHLRIWSAACSTGEEPYSIAMALLSHFPPDSGWQVDILATDISTRVLERAVNGIWPINRAGNIPEPFLKRFMLRGTGAQQGLMKAGPAVRGPLRFERINLNDAHWPVQGPFDAIFCRNVLIYFDQASRTRVINRLIDLLAPDSHLFLGHAESITGMTGRVRSVMPAVYSNAVRPRTAGRER